MTNRMLVVVVMLLLSSWFVRAVGHGDPVALNQPFSRFPDRLAEWQGEDLRFNAKIEHKLGATDYLSKMYRAGPHRVAHLYVGFYASQKHGEMVHSPKNCLPGNGWYIAKRDTATIDIAPFAPFAVNSYIVENGIERQLVVYWYQQAGGRIVTNEYLGRAYLVLDSLTRDRSVAALIRVSVPFDTDPAAAADTARNFLRVAYPALMRFLPDNGLTPNQPRPGD
jgi:EpsI family protein